MRKEMQHDARSSLLTARANLIFMIGLICLLAVTPSTAQHSVQTPPTQDQSDEPLLVVRIRAPTPDEALQLIRSGIDLLGIRDGADLFALVTPTEQAALLAAGWSVQVDTMQTAQFQPTRLQAFPSGYRTVEDIEAFLYTMATTYPHLTTLVRLGESWERHHLGPDYGYDLLALRITHRGTPGPKPVFVLLAAIHARELTTAEIAIRFIDYLLTHYGTDANVTWMLREHEIVVIPMANPDGRKLAEQGYFQRKNTNYLNGDTCARPPQERNQYGVDLNRNFAFAWGTIDGPHISPCRPVYPGPTPASEPETQALQGFIRSLYPDHTRPTSVHPAPATTTGILISLHSYSDMVLWPWGHTTAPAPNEPALARLGQRLAQLNGYLPMQSVFLYPTSGTTDDWSYGELGLASYTFEIGPSGGICGGFMPPYACIEGQAERNFWAENLPALLYAARVVRAPYLEPAGPDVHDLTVVYDSRVLTLTATLDGRNQPVAAAALYVGDSFSAAPIALQPRDGAFNGVIEQAQIVLDLTRLNPSRATASADPELLFLVQAQNAAGDRGPISAIWVPDIRRFQTWLPLVYRHEAQNPAHGCDESACPCCHPPEA